MAVVLLLAAACGDDDGSGANPERFCEIDAEIEQLENPLGLPPDEAREAVREGRRLLDELVKVAPDEIRLSAESFADSFTPVIDLFVATGFDVTQVDEAELDAAFEAAFSGESADAVGEWTDSNCSA